MIKIKKSDTPPQVLVDNKITWTNDLMDAVKKYGEYAKIPKELKKNLIRHYRNQEIKDSLFGCSYHKCAFCECIPSEGGNIEVEHFYPKSLYPNLTFEWDNLLPVCRKCNEAKGSHDTKAAVIVNPTKDNPKELFKFRNLTIEAIEGGESYNKAKRSIEVLKLNYTWLIKARASILVNLTIYINELREWFDEYAEADTKLKKRNRILKLINSIDTIDILISKHEKYSAFSYQILINEPLYCKAKEIIKTFREGEL